MCKTLNRKVVYATVAIAVVLAFGAFAVSGPCPCRAPTATELLAAPYGGIPVPDDSGLTITILENPGFENGYSFDKQGPLWTSYYVFPCDSRCKTQDRPSWLSDPDVERQVPANAYAYITTHYERGHMEPKYAIETRYGQDAMRETFRMSNAWPQRSDLNGNGGPWRRLEWLIAEADECYADALGGVWVITGPIFDKYLEQLPSGVEIPDAFYKIIIDETDEGTVRALSFIMPREATGGGSDDGVKLLLQKYLVSIDDIEDATGFDFLWNISNPIDETQPPKKLWITADTPALPCMSPANATSTACP